MAVLDRSYRRWTGQPTPYWERMLVIPRYALGELLKKRLNIALLVFSLTPPLGLAVAVYLSVNLDALKPLLPFLAGVEGFEIGSNIYHAFWSVQTTFAMVFAIVVGPPLMSGDMANNALPLYFSKALRRIDYVLGKGLVLVTLISLASWIPLAFVSLLHYAMADAGWRSRHGGTFFSLTASSLVLILVMTAIVLAVSAMVQRTRLARVGLFAILVMSSAFAGGMTEATNRDGFWALSPLAMVGRIGEWAFGHEMISRSTGALIGQDIPVTRGLAVLSLVVWTSFALWLLFRRIRPAEEVR